MFDKEDITDKQLNKMNNICGDSNHNLLKYYKYSFEVHQLAMSYNITCVVLNITYDLKSTLIMYNPNHRLIIELLESQKQILIDKINKLYKEIKEL